MGSYAARVRREHGRLDILVNNIWGGYEQYDAKLFGLPMWEQPVWHRDRMMNAGVRAHYTSSRALVPLMLDAPHSLVVNISAGDEGRFLGDVQYDAAKAAIDRLAFALSRKLKRHGVVALSVHPGFTRTERVLAAASASDPNVSGRAGGVYKAGQLGLDYGFSDVDGSQPEPFRIPEADE
jgi:NAD(P)-dependent dehydrogenase (short-subunit alcohol dehydrogenase family)